MLYTLDGNPVVPPHNASQGYFVSLFERQIKAIDSGEDPEDCDEKKCSILVDQHIAELLCDENR